MWREYFAAPIEKMTYAGSAVETRVLQYAGYYADIITHSAAMNHTRWERGRNLAASLNALIDFSRRRADFLNNEWGNN